MRLRAAPPRDDAERIGALFPAVERGRDDAVASAHPRRRREPGVVASRAAVGLGHEAAAGFHEEKERVELRAPHRRLHGPAWPEGDLVGVEVAPFERQHGVLGSEVAFELPRVPFTGHRGQGEGGKQPPHRP